MNLIQRIFSWLSKNQAQKTIGKTMNKVSKTVNAVAPKGSGSTTDFQFGTATILSAQQIKQGNGANVQVSAKLTVNDGKGKTWPAQVMAIVPASNIAKFKNGNVIPVQYDKNNPSKVRIVPG